MDIQNLLIIICICIVVFIAATLRMRRTHDDFSWTKAIFGGVIEIFTGPKSLLDDDGPRKRSGPEMAYSAGRDAAHKSTQLRQIFIPMEPHEDAEMRAFYLGQLGLTEMRRPNSHIQQDGFWAVTGTRQIYFGTMPDFKNNLDELPGFPIKNLSVVAEQLNDLGHATEWDRRISYVERLVVVDPLGNKFFLIAG